MESIKIRRKWYGLYIGGVIVGDGELEKYEERTKKHALNENENGIKSCIYDGIKVTKDQEEILQLPPGHKVFHRLKISEMENELEKFRIKSRWKRTR